ncbi:hypothetical protein B0F90DRAFT_1696996 [Multifurca ochricompacta]|uniref:F-box domain-containing protein n=1 Tax=Multifurca ochricompacta TaxID=376703 RepID=A0AAD4M9C6_9AGAM|nr:hypothetical protein B0F90DRAFT_1696996 [Multifurca ochricompacta]
MRLTRAAARALIEQRHKIVDNLPGDVLLEIFDSYRSIIKHLFEKNHRRVWNSRHGWFKLAHVCRNWRLVVLASSSRLHLRLFFTVHRSPRAVMLTRLPPLPITVDYPSGANNHLEQNRLVNALRSPNRVHEIAFQETVDFRDKFLKVTNHPFPKLRRLVLHHELSLSSFPTKLFSGATPCLQHLWVTGASLSSLSSLLLSASSLVDLTLDQTLAHPSSASSLCAYLQCMPYLRYLKLQMREHSKVDVVPLIEAKDPIPLLRLTCFHFVGSRQYLEALLSGLTAPFLKDVHILPKGNADGDSLLDPIPNLSRFICDIDKPFSAVRISFSEYAEDLFRNIILTDLCSTNESPFKIYVPGKMVSMAHICGELSVKLAEVEDLFLSSTSHMSNRGSRRYGILWSGLFGQFHNVKKLWVQCGLKLEIAYFLGEDDGKLAMGLLPELKEIYLLCDDHFLPSTCCDAPTMVRNALEPFCTARDRADLPVDLIWRKHSECPFNYNN